MPRRECITCRRLHDQRTARCPDCEQQRQRDRERARPTAAQRGYDAEWRRFSKQVIEFYGRCADCGHTGSPDNPLTTDHVIPKAHGGPPNWANAQVRCRRCNSSKGTRTTT